MAQYPVYLLGSLNLRVNPLLHKGGDLLRSVNVETTPYGAKRKRPGYVKYLGTTPNGSQTEGLFNWTKNNGTQFWNYNFAGGKLYYSTQGTGAWTICGEGTLSASGTLTHAVLEDTLMVADGAGSTRHTTNGTAFTKTTAAPMAVSLTEYHQRIFAAGTASNLFWSTTGTPSDWTSDSSSVLIPGEGKLLTTFRLGDEIVATKNSGRVFKYNEDSLRDTATNLGPTSSRSIADIEDYRIYLNRLGFFGFSGERPQLLSNPIERQVRNDVGEGIIGTTFDNAPATTHQYRYYCTIGTVTDDITDEEVADCVAVYDMQLNEWWNYKFAQRPTAWMSYKDVSGDQQLIFGSGNNGQCYKVAGTATDDDGTAAEAIMEGVIHCNDPGRDKEWKKFLAFANPGCAGHIQVAPSSSFSKRTKKWINLGNFKDGIVEYDFPSGSRSKLLFWKFTEVSKKARFQLYGFELTYA